MTNKELAIIFKGMAHILYNQAIIMEEKENKSNYAIDDTKELSTQLSNLAKKYYNEDERL